MSEELTKSVAGARINPPVFLISTILILGFVLMGAAAPEFTGRLFEDVQGGIVRLFGWFYMLAVAIFLIFTIGLGLSSYGSVKLGPDHSEPDFSNLSWFAMLFSAGMGIGLMFFGVAEPVMHYTNPPVGEGGTLDAAREALRLTFFHWGLHAWAIYAVIGLSLAYFGYRYKLPLTIRSALYPLIGDRIYGPIGHAADIFAVFGTMFGVATSLGLGVLQINSGLSYVFGVEQSTAVQLMLIAGITAIATLSVVSGLDVGIRRISEFNLLLALGLVLFVLIAGPTLFLLRAVVQNTGAYLSHIVAQSFNVYAYDPNSWLGNWTIFYWSWWIAWSPFVGMFIARVSRGRTIREFVMGVLFVPVGFTFIWMTCFGNTAISLDMGTAAGAISAAANADVSTAIFKFFEYLPFPMLTSILATILVVTFFVTSSDSGSLVIDIITSGGEMAPPVWQRIFWAVLEGVVAAILLLAGGLQALQTAAITAALPFVFVMLFVCYGILNGLRLESYRRMSRELPFDAPVRGAGMSWQKRLATIISLPTRAKAQAFLRETAEPALQEVAQEFRKQGIEAEVTSDEKRVALTTTHGEEDEFHYGVRLRGYEPPSFALVEMPFKSKEARRKSYRAEVYLVEGGQQYDIFGYTKEQLIADVLRQYERHRHVLHLSA